MKFITLILLLIIFFFNEINHIYAFSSKLQKLIDHLKESSKSITFLGKNVPSNLKSSSSKENIGWDK